MTTARDDESSSPDGPRDPGEAAQPRSRPHVLHGSTYRVLTPVGTAFVTVNSDAESNIREVFVTVGRAGSDIMADAEALGRLISLVLSIPTRLPSREIVASVIDQLSGIGGSSSLGYGSKRVRSLADAVAQVLAEHSEIANPTKSERIANKRLDPVEEITDVGESAPSPVSPRGRTGDFCPSCGQMNLVNEEGCRKCYGCGFSSC